MSVTTVFILIRPDVMTNMSASYPHVSRINATVYPLLSFPVYSRVVAYTQVRIAAACLSLLRIDWYSNYEMCRFQQRDREEREGEGRGRGDNMPMYLYV